ncbi:hypothetical protein HT102_12325 [Hoyosella sp. G463]|uniref:Secreted protein n=1 Tax=Lolliginicoccus lacisalsi TaxID=2742202 RepID=A0A927JEC1_9ACTN|nr:hypothetical protein [Lolliginicoccus lacisalsi]MBD8507270.1 hypothetical protein [Lolliginicoccus lacisalsi]
MDSCTRALRGAATAAALLLATIGCGMNTGGDVTCATFSEQSTNEKRETAAEFLRESSDEPGETDAADSEAAVDAAVLIIITFCAVEENKDIPIRDADLDSTTESSSA